MAGPMYGQSQFKEYGAEPGKYLLQGMQVGSQMRKNEADTAMTNQYKNQLMQESQQKMATQQREDDPARIENLLLGLSAITTEDKNEFNHAKEIIHGGLSDEEKQRLGDHKKWSRVDVGRYLGKQTTGKDIGPLLQFLSKDTANKTKAEIADKKLTGKAALKDPKVMSAWFNLSKTMDPEQRTEGLKLFSQKINEGMDVMSALEHVSSVVDANKQDYENTSDTIGAENKGKRFWEKSAPQPKRKSLMDTASEMGGGGMGADNDPIIQTGTDSQGRRVGKTKNGKIVPLGK